MMQGALLQTPRISLVQIPRFLACWCALLLVLNLLDTSLLTEAFSTKGFYAVTGIHYVGRTYQLWSVENLPSSRVPDFIDPIVYCARHCIAMGNCRSFKFRSSMDVCYPIAINSCESPGRILLNDPGTVQYDVMDGSSPTASQTCVQTCLESGGTCSSCGVGGACSGPLCLDGCVQFCWEIEPMVEALIMRVGYSTGSLNILCSMQWQRMWSTKEKYTLEKSPSDFDRNSLKLKLIITYDNADTRTLFFADVVLPQSHFLVVGSPLPGGDADTPNYWNAPFTARSALVPADPNCLPFFYESDPCPVVGNYSTPRFIWPLTGGVNDDLAINDIEIWVTLSTNPN